jgi:hypothetical protein
MVRGQKMKAIQEAIAKLEAEKANFILRIDGRIEGLKEALRLQGGQSAPHHIADDVARKRTRRGNLKETVLELAESVREKGLTADECVFMAKELKDIDLVLGSVSSLLSRLKTDKVLFFDGNRYRLQKYSGPRQAA